MPPTMTWRCIYVQDITSALCVVRAYFSSFIPIVFYATHRNFLMVCYFPFSTPDREKILHCNKWINVFQHFTKSSSYFLWIFHDNITTGCASLQLSFPLWCYATIPINSFLFNVDYWFYSSVQEGLFYILGINWFCGANEPQEELAVDEVPDSTKVLH